VLAVTASDRNGTPAPYANTGGFVDVMAPGRTYMDFNGTTYMVNGTSASAAYISGLAASLSSTTGRPVQDIALDLKASLPGP
jgi:phage tail sheath gpL-like